MTCFSPLTAYRTEAGDIKFVERGAIREVLELPCGQCIGCRLERSRQWAVRCMKESQLHADNAFVTLTYSDDNLPPGGSLQYSDFQRFFKRLRKSLHERRIRFFMSGEYGEATFRPHYHAIIFGYWPEDAAQWRFNDQGHALYTSVSLERLWGLGNVEVGAVSYQSAGYVARYCLKKVTGHAAKDFYRRVDQDGVITDLVPPFTRMSLKPGIAGEWFNRFRSDVFPRDYVVSEGMKGRVPRYFDRLLSRDDPDLADDLSAARVLRAVDYRDNNTVDRLAVRRVVTEARTRSLSRSLE